MTRAIELDDGEWQQVISALAMTNPVLVKISSQLAQKQRELDQAEECGQRIPHPGNSIPRPGNSKEPHP